jgi:N-acetylmuramic acid 6-phosphate etherase
VENAEDDTAQGVADLKELALTAQDAVVGITASGTTPYALAALKYAREIGALTIGLACNKGMPIEQVAEINIIPVVGAEVISGSTRMKSGTAQKMVLNMLSTGTMVLLGKTFGNLMVDVKLSNVKLRRRANNIVRQATGLSEKAVTDLLLKCNDEVKTAIVCALAHVAPEEARQRLEKTNGFIRRAIENT